MAQLNEDIFSEIVKHASPDDLAAISCVSKTMETLAIPELYREIHLDDADKYLKLLTHVPFEIIRGDLEYPQDPDRKFVLPRLYQAPEYSSSKKNYVRRHTRTIILDAPPSETLIEQLVPFHPVFERKYRMNPIGPKDTDDHLETFDGWSTIPLERLIINSTEDEYTYYKPFCKLVSPRHFELISRDDWANAWRTNYAVIDSCWTTLETISLEDCLPIRPEQGDMGECIAVPERSCPKLRTVTLSIKKWDGGPDVSRDQGEKILSTVFHEVPLPREWPEFSLFEVRLTGKERLKKLETAFEEFVGFAYEAGYDDPGCYQRLVKLTLLPGEVGPEPEPMDSDEYDSDEYDDYTREMEDEFYGDMDFDYEDHRDYADDDYGDEDELENDDYF